MTEPAAITYLFTDIEGSTRLWEDAPERMRIALARHDTICHAAVARHRGTIVKTTGDGVHAAFERACDAVAAAVDMQLALAVPEAGDGLALRIRCGLHCGVDERRDGDFYGRAVNRAARIMSAAHGGQILVSQAVADAVGADAPPGVSLRDLGAVRLRDLAAPERVYQVLHPRLRADFPALRSLEATPNNLAQQLNSFVGRGQELADVRRMLAASRLVTLLGMGGIGKSRLSVQLGAEVLDEYPDGVWLIELAPLGDAQLVPQAVASVLGVKEEAGGTVLDALLKFARERTLLIILDNCEHLVAACADLAKRLLQSAPKVKILATSRDALQIAGETVFQLAPLAAPDPRAQATSDAALVHSDAVRLFVDRARAAQPAFRLTADNSRTVATICHQLDGIPLALELAAARTRALSVEAIAARLNERFRLLVTGDRTVLPRQRTLRALIDWSYDLLAPPERTLFQRLSVFAGGWTLEAAEAVGAGGDIDAADVLDLLARLVEKSLVIADIDGGRYRMLETVRQYAHEKLQEYGGDGAARERHLAYYVRFADAARTELVGPSQGVWLERLDRDLDNVLAAHAWCDRAAGGAELGLRLVFSIKFYLLSRGLLALGERLAIEALARPQAQASGLSRCRGLAVAGQFYFYRGQYREARRYLADSLAVAREMGDPARVASALQPLGMACLGDGDLRSARAHLEEAVELSARHSDERSLGAALNALAQLCRVEGRIDEAQVLSDRVLAIFRMLGDRDSIAIAQLNKAMLAISRGATAGVANMLVEVLDIAIAIGSKPVGQSALEVASAYACLRGDAATAARFFGAAEAQAQRTGLRRDPADDAFLRPIVLRIRSALGDAAYADAERLGRILPYEEAIGAARDWLGAAG
ncbi:MAG: adenylate/guanylate cyclase domain-containing protein [Pseudomonadota bacterium]